MFRQESLGSIIVGTSPISLGGTSALNLNMANANTWTALQTFSNASTTNIGSTGSAYFATSGGNVGIGTTSPASLLHVSAGISATTTIEFGAQDITSKTCFNIRDVLGAATSFYFQGTTMIIEANRCK